VRDFIERSWGHCQVDPELMQWPQGYFNELDLPRLSLPARDYRPLYMALLSLQPELSRHPRGDARTGRESLARGHPAGV
jgi:hypothetical protein